MFLKLFVETYSSDNIFPEMYTSNVIRKSDLMYAFINKILNDKNEQHSSESDPEYIKRKFALERYLPAVAYEMMLMHKYSINNEVLKYLRSMVFNSNYFERFENEDEVISEKITSLKEINNICIKEFSLLNKSNDNYAFSHQVWQDFFCGKFYALCIKYDILEPFENAMPESVKQFIGEIIGECDFEEKDNLKNWTESPIEHFMQQHNMNSGNPISPIDTSNLIDIMKTCRNKKITACYDSLDLKYVNISRCDLRNSTFNYAKIYRFNFLAQGHRDLIISVAISPNGKKIVSGGADKTIRIWDARTGIQIGEPLTGHTDSVSSVAISPNGKKIVSGGRDGTIHIWDAETGKHIGGPLIWHSSVVESVVISQDGKKIVSGSDDKTIRIWDLETGEQIGEPLTGHTNYISSIAISQDGKRIVSGSTDKTIRIWDLEIGRQIGDSLTGHTGVVSSVAISPDGKKIVSGSYDKTIRIWDTEIGRQIGEPLTGHTDSVSSVAISQDGKRIVSGSNDGTIRIWDTEIGRQIGEPLTGHTDYISSIAISQDGKRIVSGSTDKTIRIWDTETGRQIGDPLTGHTGVVSSVAISQDGKRIASGSNDVTLCIWDMEKKTRFTIKPILSIIQDCHFENTYYDQPEPDDFYRILYTNGASVPKKYEPKSIHIKDNNTFN